MYAFIVRPFGTKDGIDFDRVESELIRPALDELGLSGGTTGELVYQERISGMGKVYASVVLGDGKLYAVTRTKGTLVYAAGREFKELARNDLGDDSVFNATPTIGNGRLLLRSDKFLYSIGK